jgi:hypothetical protein
MIRAHFKTVSQCSELHKSNYQLYLSKGRICSSCPFQSLDNVVHQNFVLVGDFSKSRLKTDDCPQCLVQVEYKNRTPCKIFNKRRALNNLQLGTCLREIIDPRMHSHLQLQLLVVCLSRVFFSLG